MYRYFFKRLFDFFLSGLAIIILSPIMLILALIIKIDSKGPVFFKQKRVGRHSDSTIGKCNLLLFTYSGIMPVNRVRLHAEPFKINMFHKHLPLSAILTADC